MILVVLLAIILSLILAPLGCLTYWKRYFHFSDSLAHASLLSGSISTILQLPLTVSGLIVALGFAVTINKFKKNTEINSAINVTSHSMLALALLLTSMNPQKININSLLFGDILTSTINDLLVLFAIGLLIYLFIYYFYDQIILMLIDDDIAKVQGINVELINLLFLILLSVTVFMVIKVIGVLLVSTTLIMPAMAARYISSSPRVMIYTNIIISLLANLMGIILSFYIDLPVSPVIVLVLIIIYVTIRIVKLHKT